MEVARIDADHIAVRDGKKIDQPHLTFTGQDWRTFLDAISAGEYHVD